MKSKYLIYLADILNLRKIVSAKLGNESTFEAFADLFQRKLEQQSVSLKTVKDRIAQVAKQFSAFNQEVNLFVNFYLYFD